MLTGDRAVQWVGGGQALPHRIVEELPVIRPESLAADAIWANKVANRPIGKRPAPNAPGSSSSSLPESISGAKSQAVVAWESVQLLGGFLSERPQERWLTV